MEKNSTYGLVILLGAALSYASYGIFSKIIGGAFAPFTQSWTRSIITLLLFVGFCLYKKFFTKIRKEDIKWYFIVGIVGALALAPTFYSLANLNLGTALFISYAATVIVSYFIGSVFLGEKLTKTNLTALLLSLAGLLLVYWGDIHFEAGKIVPVLAAFASGTLFSIWFSFSKKISSKYPTPQINTYGYAFAVIVNLAIALALGEPLNTNFASSAWLANIGYGIVGFAGSGLSVYGFKYIEAHKGSIVLLSEIVFGTLFGLFLFHELLSLTTIAGGVLILASIALPNIYKMRISRNVFRSNAPVPPRTRPGVIIHFPRLFHDEGVLVRFFKRLIIGYRHHRIRQFLFEFINNARLLFVVVGRHHLVGQIQSRHILQAGLVLVERTGNGNIRPGDYAAGAHAHVHFPLLREIDDLFIHPGFPQLFREEKGIPAANIDDVEIGIPDCSGILIIEPDNVFFRDAQLDEFTFRLPYVPHLMLRSRSGRYEEYASPGRIFREQVQKPLAQFRVRETGRREKKFFHRFSLT